MVTTNRFRAGAIVGFIALFGCAADCASSDKGAVPVTELEDGEEGGGADSSIVLSDDGSASETGSDAGLNERPSPEASPNASDDASGGPSADAVVDSGSSGPVDAETDDGDVGSACSGGTAGVASDATGVASTPVVSAYGVVKFVVSTQTQLVGLVTTLTVPALPLGSSGTLYAWPGIQPYSGSQNLNPIGDGILQSVLSWGPTCGPGAPNNHSTWWISGEYVNTQGPAGHNGCLGGPGLTVTVGDNLAIAMTLSGTVWTQLVTDRQTGHSVSYAIDMEDQWQNWATLAIEEPGGAMPVSDVVFTSTKLTFAAADQGGCQPSQRGPNDYFATPYVSADGKTCCISRVVLRAQGVPATTPNGP
jgi:hypothetical protein